MKTRGKPLKFGTATKKVGVVVPQDLWDWAIGEGLVFSEVMYAALKKLQDEYSRKDFLDPIKTETLMPHWAKFRVHLSKRFGEFYKCPYQVTDHKVNPFFSKRGIVISNSCLNINWPHLNEQFGKYLKGII